MDLIQERIQAAIKPLEQRLDIITQQQKQLAEECSNLKQLLGAKKDTKNLNTTITSVDRKRVMTLTSPSNRTASKPVLTTTSRGLKNQITSPQVPKKSVNSRPVTAFTKPKVQVKPLGPVNTVKPTPIRSTKSPINQVSSNAHKKVAIGKSATPVQKSVTSKSVKSENKPITQTKPQISQPIQEIKQQVTNIVSNSQKTQTKQKYIQQSQPQPQQQKQKTISTQQQSIKKQSIVALPQVSINQPQTIISNLQKPSSKTQQKCQKINPLQTTIQQDTKTLQVDDLKLQNINSAFSVQQKTEKDIAKVQNLACSILKQPDQVFASFIENPTSTNNLTNQCLQEPGSDQIL